MAEQMRPGDGQGPEGTPQAIVAAVTEATERGQVLIREEIELLKAELTDKLTKIAKGAAVGVAAGIFIVAGLLFLLHGFAWLAWFLLPVGDNSIFWGFFLVAFVLFVIGAIAGFVASRFVKSGTPPAPQMAIDEAKLLKETVTSEHPTGTLPAPASGTAPTQTRR